MSINNREILKLLCGITTNLHDITKETDGKNAFIYNKARTSQIDVCKLIDYYKTLQADKLYDKTRDKIEILKHKLKNALNDEDAGVTDIYEITISYNRYMKRLNKLMDFINYYSERI